MQATMLSPLASWQNFYVIIGTAAATLTGLMFVVITVLAGIRARAPLSGDGIAAFSTPSIFHYGAALLVAALLCAPWQALWQAGLLLGLVGLAGMSYVVIVLRRFRRQDSYQPVLEDWLWHTIFPLLSYTAFVAAAIMLLIDPVLALFVTGAAMVLLLFIGIHNAWDNVTYLAFEYSRSESQRQDK
jgi:hypothetical protein